jgi:hypothetical protein
MHCAVHWVLVLVMGLVMVLVLVLVMVLGLVTDDQCHLVCPSNSILQYRNAPQKYAHEYDVRTKMNKCGRCFGGVTVSSTVWMHTMPSSVTYAWQHSDRWDLG